MLDFPVKFENLKKKTPPDGNISNLSIVTNQKVNYHGYRYQ